MRAATLIACLALAACDASLASADFKGTPLIHLSGRLTGDAPQSAPAAAHLAVLWQKPGGTTEPRLVGELVEISNLGFPAQFQVDLYAEPPAAALAELDGGKASAGVLVAVDDVDGDRRIVVDGLGIRAPDALFGVDYETLLLFARPASAAALAHVDNPSEVRDGFQLARVLCGSSSAQLTVRAVPPSTEVVVTMGSSAEIVGSEFLDRCLPR